MRIKTRRQALFLICLWVTTLITASASDAIELKGGKLTLVTPVDVWENFDPDAGDFKEEIVVEKTDNGIYYRESYISAYVNGEEVRVYCKYAVKQGAKNAPGLMDVHGWMGIPRVDMSYVNDGWAVMAHDYCGKSGSRPHYTKYPESLRHGDMDKQVGFRIKSKMRDGRQITDPSQTDDYLWYAIQRRAISYLLAQKEVDATRIGAKGFSYGGTIMWNLGMNPRVKATVAYFGIGWLEYYRTRSLWMHNVPYREPKKSSGEALYLSAIAPQAHAPYITAASLWLNGSNDHHGGHERSEQTFKMFKPGVPWDFAIQARGHHNTDKLGDDCKIWLEKYVLGKKHFWPERPVSKIQLDAHGVPELHVTPASVNKITELKAYYALKESNNIARFWRDAEAVRHGDTWVAKLPVLNVDDYVFSYANVRYENDIVISSDFAAAIPSKLGKAVATDKKSSSISEGTGQWTKVGPAEGVGGVKGFRPLDNRRGTTNEQFFDPKWCAPKGAKLRFKFYCTQPQTLVLRANRNFAAVLKMSASDEWQTMTLSSEELKNHESSLTLGDWSEIGSINIKPRPESDITKVVFAGFEWIAE